MYPKYVISTYTIQRGMKKMNCTRLHNASTDFPFLYSIFFLYISFYITLLLHFSLSFTVDYAPILRLKEWWAIYIIVLCCIFAGSYPSRDVSTVAGLSSVHTCKTSPCFELNLQPAPATVTQDSKVAEWCHQARSRKVKRVSGKGSKVVYYSISTT